MTPSGSGSRRCRTILILWLSVFPVVGYSVAAQPLEGAWKSEGYGNVYEIHGSTMKAFEVTTQTCVPGFTATRVGSVRLGLDEVFRVKGRDPITISAGKGPDEKMLDHSIQIHRLPHLPEVCSAPTANTPFGISTYSRALSRSTTLRSAPGIMIGTALSLQVARRSHCTRPRVNSLRFWIR